MWTVVSSLFIVVCSSLTPNANLATAALLTGLTSTAYHLCGALGLIDRFPAVRVVDILVARTTVVYVGVIYFSLEGCALALYGIVVYLIFVRRGSWEDYCSWRPPFRVLMHASMHVAFGIGVRRLAMAAV